MLRSPVAGRLVAVQPAVAGENIAWQPVFRCHGGRNTNLLLRNIPARHPHESQACITGTNPWPRCQLLAPVATRTVSESGTSDCT